MIYGILIGVIIAGLLILFTNGHDTKLTIDTNQKRAIIRIIGFVMIVIAFCALVGKCIGG